MRTTGLVNDFRQSAPYVNAHRGKTFVVMLGGEAIVHPNFRSIINDIALLNSLGIRIVLVYGARPQIDSELQQRSLQTAFHNGVRVTDDQAFTVIKQVAGALQLDITARLSMSLANTPMQGADINVVSGNFVIAQPMGVVEGIDYCHSGKVRRIDVEGIRIQLDNSAIVLHGPIAASVTGESFNLTAEEIATRIAVKLRADKMIGFGAEQGIKDELGEVIAELLPDAAEQALQRLSLTPTECSSEIPFLRAAIEACRQGVARCHLLSYQLDGALLQELFSIDGIGTQVVTESAEQVRNATIRDIGGILDLIRPLEQAGVLVRRSREQLEMEINKFTIVEREGLVIGCAALYPYEDEQAAELACLAVHQLYRDAERGLVLLKLIIQQAKKRGFTRLFALTTHSIHWFLEQGFIEVSVDDLPATKKQSYNLQRRSKVLLLNI